MNASSRWQEVVSENLASSQIPGYKSQSVSFNAIAPSLATQAGARSYPLVKAQTGTNFSQGELSYTGATNDVAIDGKGFFEVQLPDGSHGFTRDGRFHISNAGQLTTVQGYPVMGQNGPIQLTKTNDGPITISATGQVSQGSDARGQLKVVDVADTTSLAQVSGALFKLKDGAQQPTAVTNPNVRQGFVETANTSSVGEMAGLISSMRSFEINQKVIQAQDDRMGKAITDLGNPVS